MEKIESQLESVEGVEDIQETRFSKSGLWFMLIRNDITRANLNKIDTIIRDQTSNTLGYKPRRAVKGEERVNINIVEAIIQRQAEEPPPKHPNKWKNPLFKTTRATDERSVNTSITTSSYDEQIEVLQDTNNKQQNKIEIMQSQMNDYVQKLNELSQQVNNRQSTMEKQLEEKLILQDTKIEEVKKYAQTGIATLQNSLQSATTQINTNINNLQNNVQESTSQLAQLTIGMQFLIAQSKQATTSETKKRKTTDSPTPASLDEVKTTCTPHQLIEATVPDSTYHNHEYSELLPTQDESFEDIDIGIEHDLSQIITTQETNMSIASTDDEEEIKTVAAKQTPENDHSVSQDKSKC